ncbi:MAG TPA: hypothetical protein VGB31_03805 [Myxococcota bacterium]
MGSIDPEARVGFAVAEFGSPSWHRIVKSTRQDADLRSEMRDTSLLQLAVNRHQGRYRVRLLENPELRERGIAHGDPANPGLVEWSAIRWALAAEVGEPEGVRTIIFDLVVDRVSEPGGGAFEVRRLDAEPGEEAMRLAMAIERALAPGLSAPSIKSLATEGSPSRWYQDLEEFEAAALESLDS